MQIILLYNTLQCKESKGHEQSHCPEIAVISILLIFLLCTYCYFTEIGYSILSPTIDTFCLSSTLAPPHPCFRVTHINNLVYIFSFFYVYS